MKGTKPTWVKQIILKQIKQKARFVSLLFCRFRQASGKPSDISNFKFNLCQVCGAVVGCPRLPSQKRHFG